MAMTPEGRVKKQVSALLAAHGCYYFMPVQAGYGMSTLDYLGCHNGHFFAIETKKPGGKPTTRQQSIMSLIESSGGAVFVIDGDLSALENWLLKHK
jgi:hypothetical protein